MKNNYLPVIFGVFIPISSGIAMDNVERFIGAKAGYQWAHDDEYRHSDPDVLIGGVFGGLRFTPSWSWDLGYQYHGNLHAKATAIDVETWLLESAVRYNWYVQDALSVYGRLGVAYWDLDKTVSSSELISSDGFSPLGEVGINYNVSKNVHLSAGYQYINGIGDSKTGEYDSHALMLGVSYVFASGNDTFQTITEIEPNFVITEPVTIETKIYTLSSTPSLNNNFTFKFDSVSVGAAFSKELKEVADILIAYPQAEVHIVGHTDSTGSEAYNQVLSERRAQSVADELERQGVEPSQMTTSGHGELNPISTNATVRGRSLNRRVELIIPEFEYQN